jgi:hypothetical protein
VDVSLCWLYFAHACPFKSRRVLLVCVEICRVLTSATIAVCNSRQLLKSNIVILNQGIPFVMEVKCMFVFVVGAS